MLTAALHGIFNGIAISSIASDGIQVFWKEIPKEDKEDNGEVERQNLVSNLTLVIID